QIAAFVKPDFGRFAVNAQMLADVPNEFSAELRKANVLGRRELMADRRGGQRGGAALIAEVLLDHQHRAAKARPGGEKVTGRAAGARCRRTPASSAACRQPRTRRWARSSSPSTRATLSALCTRTMR